VVVGRNSVFLILNAIRLSNIALYLQLGSQR